MPDEVVTTAVPDSGAGDTSSASTGTDGAIDASATGVQTDTGAESTSAGTGAEQAPVDTTQPEASQPAPFEIGAGQPLPNEFRSLFKNPDPAVAALAPKIQSMWDRLQAYTSHFPTVADAKQFSEAFPGGVKDALMAQAKAAELDEADNAYFSRDPAQHAALAKDWATNDPEAFASLAEQALTALSESNRPAYDKLGGTILEGTLSNLYRTALGVGNKDAADRIAQLHEDVFGRKLGEQPRNDPRAQELTQREQRLKTQEQEHTNRVASDFATNANSQVGKQLQSQILTNLSTALKNLKVSEGAKGRISQEIYDDINQKLIADKGLQNRLQSIAQQGRRAGFTPQLTQQWVDALSARARALLATSAKTVIDRWTQDYLGVAKATNAKIDNAASRKDVGGGGLPNHGLAPLTAEKMATMTNAEILAHQGPIDPNALRQIREGKWARPAPAK